MDLEKESPWGEDVPAVNPEDLKNTWKIQQEVQARFGPEPAIVDPKVFGWSPSPATDEKALGYRVLVLRLIVERTGFYRQTCVVRESIFDVFARFPLKRLNPGVSIQGLPLDGFEFIKQVQDEVLRRGLA